MEVSTSQIELIKKYLRQHWITNEEFITNTTQKFVDEIQQIDDKNITFENALHQTFQKFGGTEKVLALEEKFINAGFNGGIKDYFKSLQSFFTHQNKILFLVLSFTTLYFWFGYIRNPLYWTIFFIGIIVVELGFMIYLNLKNKKNKVNDFRANGVMFINTFFISFFIHYNAHYSIENENTEQWFILLNTFLNTLFVLNVYIVIDLIYKYNFISKKQNTLNQI
ncbi:MAG: hypothetical protein EAZ85_04140 [Bacteroidetes bacterium]|nr:MAG: hypothetical protein EAZ85_04140 [Bacteroidota bacterium]TAG93856.1 MAG: hypothetical protein EAZ20_01375 [Bacteroidota bacterium]